MHPILFGHLLKCIATLGQLESILCMASPQFSVRIPPQLDEKLKEYAAKNGTTKTEVMIAALANYLGCPSSPAPMTSAAQVGVQTVMLKYSKDRFSYGFLARNGYVITGKFYFENPTEITVIWQSDNKRQEAQARFEKSGVFAPQTMLLKIQRANLPQQVLPVRNSSSLKVGDSVERYLAPQDKTPGEVLEVGATRKIRLGGTSPIILKNALITTNISAVGDAGAPVLDTEGRVVAMVYGASRTETVSIPIEDIKISFPEAFSPQ